MSMNVKLGHLERFGIQSSAREWGIEFTAMGAEDRVRLEALTRCAA